MKEVMPTDNKSFLIVARHGATAWNESGKIQGLNDQPLSDLGRSQALCLAEWAAEQNIAQIYTSDLLRAFETAEIVARHINKKVELSPLLRERDKGRFEGMDKDQLLKEQGKFGVENIDPYQNWNDVPGVESNQAIWLRIKTFIQDENILTKPFTILLITHAGIIKSMITGTVSKPDWLYNGFNVENGSTVSFQKSAGSLQMIRLWHNPIKEL